MLVFRAQIGNIMDYIAGLSANTKTKNMEVRRLIFLTVILLQVLCMSSFILSNVHANGWNYMDSIYFMYTSITTIGYGDVAPDKHTEVWLLFIIWIGVILLFVTIGFAQEYFKKLCYGTQGIRERNTTSILNVNNGYQSSIKM